MLRNLCLLLAVASSCLIASATPTEETRDDRQARKIAIRSHLPMRPLPAARKTDLASGPKKFVDAADGDDAAAGTQQAPWKTLAHSLRQLHPGDTLYLRGGTYYGKNASQPFGFRDGADYYRVLSRRTSDYRWQSARVRRAPRDKLGAAGWRRGRGIRFDENIS